MSLLLISSVLCILDYVVPTLISIITDWLYSCKNANVKIYSDLLKLKHDMTKISVVDEFSKYAKMMRKYREQECIFKENVKANAETRMKIKSVTTHIFRILNACFTLVLLYLFKLEPVVIFSEGSLWPLQNILSWPCHNKNCISLPTWIGITKLVLSLCTNRKK